MTNDWRLIGGVTDADVFDFNDWEKDAEIEGLYIEKREDVGPNNSNMYIIESAEDHENYAVWGTTLLDRRFEKINLNEEVRIIFKGMETSEKSGREYKNFEVYARPAQFRDTEDDDFPIEM